MSAQVFAIYQCIKNINTITLPRYADLASNFTNKRRLKNLSLFLFFFLFTFDFVFTDYFSVCATSFICVMSETAENDIARSDSLFYVTQIYHESTEMFFTVSLRLMPTFLSTMEPVFWDLNLEFHSFSSTFLQRHVIFFSP